MTARYTGHLDRNDDGTLRFTISDSWGWEISGTGRKDPAGGYTLSGTLGATPESLRLPGEDEFRNPLGESTDPVSLPVRVPLEKIP
jgi:hypothetical protein